MCSLPIHSSQRYQINLPGKQICLYDLSFKNIYLFHFLYMCVHLCMHVSHVYVGARAGQKSCWIPGIRIMDDCKILFGCWKLNLDLL